MLITDHLMIGRAALCPVWSDGAEIRESRLWISLLPGLPLKTVLYLQGSVTVFLNPKNGIQSLF